MELLRSIWSYIGAGRDQIISVSTVFTAWFAYRGLTAWREKMKGESEYERAQKVLKAVYRLRDAFIKLRLQGIYVYEYPENVLDENCQFKSGDKFEAIDYVYTQRLKVFEEPMMELEDEYLNALVEWGDDFKDKIIPVRECIVDFRIALSTYLDSIRNDRPKTDLSSDERKEMNGNLYFSGTERDLLTPKMNEAVRGFEQFLRPKIDKRKISISYIKTFGRQLQNKRMLGFSILILFFLMAVVFAFYIQASSSTYIYDFNYKLFNTELSQGQKDSIYCTVKSCIKISFFPLLITNILTLIYVGVLLFLFRRTTTSSPQKASIPVGAQRKSDTDKMTE